MADVSGCELISWHEVYRLCRKLSERIITSGYRPDLIVAVARGGYVPARLLCDFIGINELTSIRVEHYYPGAKKQTEARIRDPLSADIAGRRVLLVDDVNDSGDTFRVAVPYLQSFQPAELRTAVAHSKTVSDFAEDYCGKRILKWRWIIYPWAVVEDLGAFMQAMSPKPATAEEAQKRLLECHGVRVKRETLEHIFAFRADVAS